jgi:uncharacterized OB-fold protein
MSKDYRHSQRAPGSTWWFSQMRPAAHRQEDSPAVHRCPRCGCRHEPAGEVCAVCRAEAIAPVQREEVVCR